MPSPLWAKSFSKTLSFTADAETLMRKTVSRRICLAAFHVGERRFPGRRIDASGDGSIAADEFAGLALSEDIVRRIDGFRKAAFFPPTTSSTTS